MSESPDPASHHTPTLAHSHSPCQLTTTPSLAVVDTLVWQGLASVVVPGFTINRLCAVSRVLLSRHARRLLPQQARKWATVAVGLGSIPFIIHPIDWWVFISLLYWTESRLHSMHVANYMEVKFTHFRRSYWHVLRRKFYSCGWPHCILLSTAMLHQIC